VPVPIKDIIATRGYANHKRLAGLQGCFPTPMLGSSNGCASWRDDFSAKRFDGICWRHPGPTVNRVESKHRAGRFSSVPRQAVAAGIVPLGWAPKRWLDHQPAAFNGVVGLKPSSARSLAPACILPQTGRSRKVATAARIPALFAFACRH